MTDPADSTASCSARAAGRSGPDRREKPQVRTSDDCRLPRRAFLGGAVGGLALLAGCSGDDDGEPAPTVPEEVTTAGPTGESFLANAKNYHGYANELGQSEVSVTVGASGEGYEHAFDPAGIMISPGTRVVWEWTDRDASYGVAALNGEFESEVTAAADHTFEQTFDEVDIYRYYCPEHRDAGMKGAVLIQD